MKTCGDCRFFLPGNGDDEPNICTCETPMWVTVTIEAIRVDADDYAMPCHCYRTS